MDETLTGLERKALRYLEEHREELNRLLAELIAVDTQNFGSNGREAALAPLVEGLYQSLGMETEVYCPDETEGFLSSPLRLPGRNTDRRPNVTGVLRGREGAGAVMLAAHSDTMPAGDLSAWEASPFEAVIRDGRITGLGACDDKFGIAGSWWAVKVLRDLGIPLKKTVVLTAYCDEEFGGGNGALAACLKYPCETYVNLDGGSYEMWATALGGGVFHKLDAAAARGKRQRPKGVAASPVDKIVQLAHDNVGTAGVQLGHELLESFVVLKLLVRDRLDLWFLHYCHFNAPFLQA